MKSPNSKEIIITIFAAIIIIYCCEKENGITRDELIGEWIFEKEVITDAWIDGYVKDTTVFYGDIILSINNTDTAYHKNLDGEVAFAIEISFIPPDSILIGNCPLNWGPCYDAGIEYFKIISLNSQSMVLRKEHEYRGVTTVCERYYSK
jgi:hypothetical protein